MKDQALKDKSVKELKALRRNWENTLIREYDVLSAPTKALIKLKIDEVKEIINDANENLTA